MGGNDAAEFPIMMRFITFLALLASVVLTLGGCYSSPHAEWAAKRDALTLVQNSVVTLNESGILSTKDAASIDPWIMAARGYLNKAKEELPEELNAPAKNKTLFEKYLSEAAGVINLIEDALERAKKSRPPLGKEIRWESPKSSPEFSPPLKSAVNLRNWPFDRPKSFATTG